MITIKLTNKVAYTLIAILVLLSVSLIVYAANPTTKPNPGHYSQEVMVNIAGADKTLQAAIDDGSFGGGGLGNWEIKVDNTVYLAEKDGFVVAYRAGNGEITGYTDSSNPPTTIRTISRVDYSGYDMQVSFPVKKGDYWKVVGGNQKVFWIPLGN